MGAARRGAIGVPEMTRDEQIVRDMEVIAELERTKMTHVWSVLFGQLVLAVEPKLDALADENVLGPST